VVDKLSERPEMDLQTAARSIRRRLTICRDQSCQFPRARRPLLEPGAHFLELGAQVRRPLFWKWAPGLFSQDIYLHRLVLLFRARRPILCVSRRLELRGRWAPDRCVGRAPDCRGSIRKRQSCSRAMSAHSLHCCTGSPAVPARSLEQSVPPAPLPARAGRPAIARPRGA